MPKNAPPVTAADVVIWYRKPKDAAPIAIAAL